MPTLPVSANHPLGWPRAQVNKLPKKFVQRCLDDLVLATGKIVLAVNRDLVGAKMAVYYPDERTLHVSPAMAAFLDSDDAHEVSFIAKHLRVIDLADARVLTHY